MRLFDNFKRKESYSDYEHEFDKEEIIQDILENKDENCPGWKFFKISDNTLFDKTNCDFIAIYTDIINKEIKIKSNPFSEYKNIVESPYQIVREIFLSKDRNDLDDGDGQVYKKIIISSAKELFIKLKKEI